MNGIVSEPADELPVKTVKSMTNCTELFMSRRYIQTLAHFESFFNLESLYLNDNLIEDISPLKPCKRLKELYLNNNLIKSFGNFEFPFLYLETFVISNNQLRNLGEVLRKLKKLKNLQILDMQNNPLCEEFQYRKKVIKALPTLLVLDCHNVSDVEREKALENSSKSMEKSDRKVVFGRTFSEFESQTASLPYKDDDILKFQLKNIKSKEKQLFDSLNQKSYENRFEEKREDHAKNYKIHAEMVLEKEEIRNLLQKQFSSADVNNKGFLTGKEFKNSLRSFRYKKKPKSQQAKQMAKKHLDSNPNIDFNAYYNILMECEWEQLSAKRLQKISDDLYKEAQKLTNDNAKPSAKAYELVAEALKLDPRLKYTSADNMNESDKLKSKSKSEKMVSKEENEIGMEMEFSIPKYTFDNDGSIIQLEKKNIYI